MRRIGSIGLMVLFSFSCSSPKLENKVSLFESKSNQSNKEIKKSLENKEFEKAIVAMKDLYTSYLKLDDKEQTKYLSQLPSFFYHISNVYSLNNQIDSSLLYLHKAVDSGYRDYYSIIDSTFNNIHEEQDYQTIVAKMKNEMDNNGILNKEADWEPFIWNESSIFVHLKIKGIPLEFIAQHDLGATTSVLNAKTINSLTKLYPESIHLNNRGSILNQGLNIIQCKKTIDQPFVFNSDLNQGEEILKEEINKNKIHHIGTIGANFYQNKVLVIDYKYARMCVLDALVIDKDAFEFVDFTITDYTGKIRFPIKIGDKTCYVFYDTGVSYPLILKKYDWVKCTKQNDIDSTLINSWGVKHYVYSSQSTKTVKFNDIELTNNSRLYISPHSFGDRGCEESDVIGYTGNPLYKNRTVVFDFINKKLGVSKRN